MEGLDAVENQSRTGRVLSKGEGSVDCVYIAASARDARYTRICVASVRYFCPGIPIRLLLGGRLQRGLEDELRRYWNVGIADLPTRGDYGWGFVKLEALFGPPGEKFLVLDSDTVLTGSVLDVWSKSTSPFLVDDEKQSEADTKRLYYDWHKVREIDPSARPPQFVFNSGQWFGTSGVLSRDDFAPWVEWTMPRRLSHPEHFMPGEQGILNYVLNQKAALEGLQVERKQIMRWPGHSMDGLDAESVSKRVAPPFVVHWAGMKKTRLQHMVGSDILLHFETFYYARFPARILRSLVANCHNSLILWQHWGKVRIKLLYSKWLRRQQSNRDLPRRVNRLKEI
jgi:hypothetical protein